MKRFLLSLTVLLGSPGALPGWAEVLVLRDGRRMWVRHYEIRGPLVVFAESEGRLLSLASDYVDLEATVETNRHTTDATGTEAPESAEGRHGRWKGPSSEPGIVEDSQFSSASNRPVPPTTGRTDVRSLHDRKTTTGSTAHEALLLIGVIDLLDDIPAETIFQTDQLRALWPGADTLDHESFRRTAKIAFATDSIKPVVVESFLRRAPEPSLRMSIDFLRSSLWQRMRELEQATQTPEGMREFQNFTSMLKNEPPSGRQQEIADRFDRALGMSRMRVELRIEILAALVEGFRKLSPGESTATNTETETWIAHTRENLTRNAEAAALTFILFSYRSLSDAELSECLEFWESEAGRSLRTAAEESVLDGLRVGGARLNVLLATDSRSVYPGLLVRADP